MGDRWYINSKGMLEMGVAPLPEAIEGLLFPSEINMSLFHWHFSEDDPNQTNDGTERFQYLTDQIPYLLENHAQTTDLFVFSGIEGIVSGESIRNLCLNVLSPSLGREQASKRCVMTDIERSLKTPQDGYNMLLHAQYMVFSPKPLRTVLSPKRYGQFPVTSCYEEYYSRGFGYFYTFEILIRKHWVKVSILTSDDYSSLTSMLRGEGDKKSLWEHCTQHLSDYLNEVVVDNEPVVIISRVFNPEIQTDDIPQWLDSTGASVEGEVVDFQPESNLLSMDIVNRWGLGQQKRQLTQVFYYKKGKRMKSIKAVMTFLDYSAIYSNRFSPFNPVSAQIILKSKFIPVCPTKPTEE